MKTAEQMANYLRRKRESFLELLEEEKNKDAQSQRPWFTQAATDKITEYEAIMQDLEIEYQKQSFYFTFGSWDKFPYGRGEYVVVKAYDIREAARKFMRKYPDPYDAQTVNCADYYNQQQWNEITKNFYKGTDPVEIIE